MLSLLCLVVSLSIRHHPQYSVFWECPQTLDTHQLALGLRPHPMPFAALQLEPPVNCVVKVKGG